MQVVKKKKREAYRWDEMDNRLVPRVAALSQSLSGENPPVLPQLSKFNALSQNLRAFFSRNVEFHCEM